MMVEYHEAMKDLKREHFNSMKYHKSADSDLKNRGLLRILEIGAGPGELQWHSSLFTINFNAHCRRKL